ncbi:MAG TPA: hypothetical protein VF556_01800 [Pyrinomonadaceae bacterium]|jgi:uncharacterized membrane protein
MEPIRVTYNELIYYLLIAGVLIGIVLGLIPLIFGIKKHNRKYGMYGFLGSVIGGAITPIISIIVVSIFTWLILRKPKADVSPTATETNTVETDSANSTKPEIS